MGIVKDDAADLRAVASRIVDAIAAAAVHHGRGATWTEPLLPSPKPRAYRTGDATLYQGSAGVAWALSDAARVLPGAAAAADLAIEAISDALSRQDGVEAGGLYDGRAGIGLAACKVGETLDEPGLVASGVEVLLQACEAAPGVAWDVIGGEAGQLAAAVAAWRLTDDDRLRDAARRLGERLVRRSCESHGGRAWAQPGEDWLPLCGLAHGASGAAWALAELAAIRPGCPARLEACVEDALRYEAAWFDQRRNAWPDLRAVPRALEERHGESGPHPTLWCHGAAGIGLSRLRIHALGGRWTAAAEAAAALQATCTATVASLRSGAASHGLTLCHGHGGAAELFVAAYETLGEPEHLASARYVVRTTLALCDEDVERWPSGVAGEVSYGLMTGLAGALSVTLRAACPGELPAVGLPGVAIEARRDARLDPEYEPVLAAGGVLAARGA